MPYLNMDDNYPDHPKVEALSDAAYRFHGATSPGDKPIHETIKTARTSAQTPAGPDHLPELAERG